MAQKRYWMFKADDKTADINRWLLGIIPKGLHTGFDAAQINTTTLRLTAPDMVLRINHEATGQTETNSSNTATAKIGKIVMPQGIVAAEDAALSFNINANASAFKRIDILIATAEYIEIEGGSEVIYSIIQGTPAAEPVAPVLPFPEKQIIIGELTVDPGTTTALNNKASWKRAARLHMGNKPDSFAYKNERNDYSGIQIFGESNATLSTAVSANVYNILIPETGNSFVLFTSDLLDASITYNDIKIQKDNGDIVDVPNGAIIQIKFGYSTSSPSAVAPKLGSSFFTSYTLVKDGISPATGNLLAGATNYLAGQKYVLKNDIITFKKTDSGWDILSWPALHVRQLNALKEYVDNALAPGQWQNVGAVDKPPYMNSWITGPETVSYRLVGQYLEFKGQCERGSGAMNQPIFTLPVGFRPPAGPGDRQFVALIKDSISGSFQAVGMSVSQITYQVHAMTTLTASSGAQISFTGRVYIGT